MIGKILITTVFLGNTLLFAQTGTIKGVLRDALNKEEVSFANIRVKSCSVEVVNVVSDIDGQYIIKNLPAGNYLIKVSSIGYDRTDEIEVLVFEGKTIYMDIQMNPSVTMITCCEIICDMVSYFDIVSCPTSCSFYCEYSTCAIAKDSLPKEKKMDIVQKEVTCILYPNPFHEYTIIQINADKFFEDAQVHIYDLSGRVVREIKFFGNRLVLERADLAPGSYIYQVSAENKIIGSGKLVIQ